MDEFVSYIHRFSVWFGYEPHDYYDIDRITSVVYRGEPWESPSLVSHAAPADIYNKYRRNLLNEGGSRGCVFRISISICRAGVPHAAAACQTRTIEPESSRSRSRVVIHHLTFSMQSRRQRSGEA